MGYKIERLMDVALKKRKAERVLKNCRVVNVFSGEIEEGDVALQDGYIAGVGRFDGIEEEDLGGKIVCPGFIDSHVHIESAMVTPPVFASVVVARGTTSVIADPHEIANVLGAAGIEYMIRSSRDLFLTVHVMVPSCVPATSFETSGAEISSRDIKELLRREGILGLGEMMNYPGVLAGDPEVLAKISAAAGRIIDGHGAGLSGDGLNAYRLAGIATDHECINAEEAKERIRLGMYVAIREGTAARNLESLLPAVNRDNGWYFMFCTDDRHLEDIMTEGHIDHCIRKAIKLGLDPVTAVRMATINPARCYSLKDQGAVAPGFRGDLAVVDSLNDFSVESVYVMGQKVAEKGRMLAGPAGEDHTVPGGSSINMAPLGADAFKVRSKSPRVPVIKIIPGSIATGSEYVEMDVGEDGLKPPSGSDILKIAVVERHRATGKVSTAFISGLGLKNGAIASSVAHDSHNIIVVGDDESLMLKAVKALKECGGGYCIVDGRNEETLCLPLPVGGLMTGSPANEVRDRLETLLKRARQLGVPEDLDPFITLSFMALPVIPSLKITDKGLFDVNSFKFVDW